MQCSLCTKVALRVVGPKGFCKDHFEDANVAAKHEFMKSESKHAVDSYYNDRSKGLRTQPEYKSDNVHYNKAYRSHKG